MSNTVFAAVAAAAPPPPPECDVLYISSRTSKILKIIRECKDLSQHIGELFGADFSTMDFDKCDSGDLDYLMKDFILPLGQTKQALLNELNENIKIDIEQYPNFVVNA